MHSLEVGVIGEKLMTEKIRLSVRAELLIHCLWRYSISQNKSSFRFEIKQKVELIIIIIIMKIIYIAPNPLKGSRRLMIMMLIHIFSFVENPSHMMIKQIILINFRQKHPEKTIE